MLIYLPSSFLHKAPISELILVPKNTCVAVLGFVMHGWLVSSAVGIPGSTSFAILSSFDSRPLLTRLSFNTVVHSHGMSDQRQSSSVARHDVMHGLVLVMINTC